MAKDKFSDSDRNAIAALRDSGLSWPEVSGQATTKLGKIVSVNSARFHYGKAKGKTRDRSREIARRPRRNVKKGHSLDEFREKFDVVKKIADKVEEIFGKDSEEYFTDDEFRGLCRVSVQNWRRHAELDRFRKYQFKKPGFHAWASPSVVEAMKEITGVQGH